jgi:hypothetical protein
VIIQIKWDFLQTLEILEKLHRRLINLKSTQLHIGMHLSMILKKEKSI